jgi:hypothetical protein
MMEREEALSLIAKLEASSQKSRPFIIFGMLAILAAFIILIAFLETQRRAAVQHAAELGEEVARLQHQLREARTLFASGTQNSAAATKALDQAIAQAGSLGETIASESAPAASKDASSAWPARLRVYIHVASADQQEAAESLASGMNNKTIGGATIEAPSVELVPNVGDNSIRCFTAADCARVGEISKWVNRHVAEPKLQPKDLRAAFPKAKPGTYEIWFRPGAAIEENAP